LKNADQISKEIKIISTPEEMNPKEISIDSYSYDLDPNKIAQYPLEKRDESKLLVYQDGGIRDYLFYEIPNLLPKGSLLMHVAFANGFVWWAMPNVGRGNHF
jgi:hypothetical protein